MLLDSISRSVSQLLSAPFRAVLWKSIGLTLALLLGLWFAMEALLSTFLLPFLGPWPWVSTALTWIFGAGLVLGMGFLIAPVSSIFAGVFLDDIADEVEKAHYPDDPPGKALPLTSSIGITLRFLGLVILGNLLALILFFFLGIGVIVFFAVNGYLLGREYFQFAALRHVSLEQAEILRKQHSTTIFLSGLAIAALLSIPFINLMTPLFAGALMVHVFKYVANSATVDPLS